MSLKSLVERASQRLQHRLAAGHGAVLMLHSVPSAEERSRRVVANPGMEVTPEFLGALVDKLRERDFELISLEEVASRCEHGQRTAKRWVAITFDDGYRDNLEQACPILTERGAPFAVFLISGFADKELLHYGAILQDWVSEEREIRFELAGEEHALPARTPEEKRAAYAALRALTRKHLVDPDYSAFFRANGVEYRDYTLSWEELRVLASHELVTIGAHTKTHRKLSSLSAQEARAEMEGSKLRIEAELGRPVEHFAYPFGDHGHRDAAIARSLGFATVSTTQHGYVRCGATEPTALPRVRVFDGTMPLV